MGTANRAVLLSIDFYYLKNVVIKTPRSIYLSSTHRCVEMMRRATLHEEEHTNREEYFFFFFVRILLASIFGGKSIVVCRV